MEKKILHKIVLNKDTKTNLYSLLFLIEYKDNNKYSNIRNEIWARIFSGNTISDITTQVKEKDFKTSGMHFVNGKSVTQKYLIKKIPKLKSVDDVFYSEFYVPDDVSSKITEEELKTINEILVFYNEKKILFTSEIMIEFADDIRKRLLIKFGIGPTDYFKNRIYHRVMLNKKEGESSGS